MKKAEINLTKKESSWVDHNSEAFHRELLDNEDQWLERLRQQKGGHMGDLKFRKVSLEEAREARLKGWDVYITDPEYFREPYPIAVNHDRHLDIKQFDAAVKDAQEYYKGLEFRLVDISEWQVFYTTAPIDYDGFSTRTLDPKVKETRSGKIVRKVVIDDRDVTWQTSRYGSGNHMAADESTYRGLEDIL